MKRTLIAVVLLVFPGLAVGQARPAASRGLQGAWRIVEVTTTGPNAGTNKNPRPGLIIFTARHYSLTREDTTRVVENVGPTTTAEQLRNRLRFSAQAGTYEVTGSEIKMTRIAALAPPNMAAGNSAINTFRMQGDTLWLTNTSSQAGTVPNPTTQKLVRVE